MNMLSRREKLKIRKMIMKEYYKNLTPEEAFYMYIRSTLGLMILWHISIFLFCYKGVPWYEYRP